MDDLQPPPATRKGLVVRVIVGAAVVAVVTLLFFQYRESLTLTRLAENEAVIRDYKS